MNRHDARGALRGLRASASLYLPALVMAMLALGSWWLVRHAPRLEDTPPSRVSAGEPDWIMQDFEVRSFDPAGRLTRQIAGARGKHYPDHQLVDVEQARARLWDEQGRTSTARGDRALVRDDRSEVHLRGIAEVVREPGARADEPRLVFRGPELSVFTQSRLVISDQPVTLLRGADQLQGDRLRYDDQTGVLELQGRVRGQLPARPAATPG